MDSYQIHYNLILVPLFQKNKNKKKHSSITMFTLLQEPHGVLARLAVRSKET